MPVCACVLLKFTAVVAAICGRCVVLWVHVCVHVCSHVCVHMFLKFTARRCHLWMLTVQS